MPPRYPSLDLAKVLALGTANNVDNLPAGPHDAVRERVIGVRAVSLWQAILEHPHVGRVPADDRLLLCCCMNVDGVHKGRLEHTKLLARYDAFDCPLTQEWQGHHISVPRNDPGRHQIENEAVLLLNGKYGSIKGMQGNYDTHMPVLMLGSKFVYSPNGIGEQCYREYEALISGAVPLVDATSYDHRNKVLRHLPVILVTDWSKITPEFLEATYRTMAQQSFDVSILYMPYWLDAILTAMGITSDDASDHRATA